MGYTTEFSGSFKLTPALTQEQINYLTAFSNSRRMKRHADLCEKKEDPMREAVGLSVGEEGEFCVFNEGHWMNSDETIIDYNQHPKNQHGLWCHWIPSEDGAEILWNGAENFYGYENWIKYINENFLKPWGIKINGNVKWYGCEEDIGAITAKDGIISAVSYKYKAPKPVRGKVMGYTTNEFTLTPALTEAQVAYLNAFSDSRRVQRDVEACETINDEVRAAVGLPVGKEGGYCVYSAKDGNYGQNDDKTVINGNKPPNGQPGLWCQWIPNETGDRLKWNGVEKFYYYEEWLHYINENFLKPWGIVIDGAVKWQGEEMDDSGEIEASNGFITSHSLE